MFGGTTSALVRDGPQRRTSTSCTGNKANALFALDMPDSLTGAVNNGNNFPANYDIQGFAMSEDLRML